MHRLHGVMCRTVVLRHTFSLVVGRCSECFLSTLIVRQQRNAMATRVSFFFHLVVTLGGYVAGKKNEQTSARRYFLGPKSLCKKVGQYRAAHNTYHWKSRQKKSSQYVVLDDESSAD